MVSVDSTASRKMRLAFWTVSSVLVVRVRFGILPEWHGKRRTVKRRKFQMDPLPKRDQFMMGVRSVDYVIPVAGGIDSETLFVERSDVKPLRKI